MKNGLKWAKLYAGKSAEPAEDAGTSDEEGSVPDDAGQLTINGLYQDSQS